MVDLDRCAARLFGAHVERRTDESSADRERLLPFEAREAKVEHAQPAIACEHQVRRF